MKESIRRIEAAISPERAYDSVKEISGYHRIQASTGYRAAANWIANKLTKQGLEVKVHSYKANPSQWYLMSKMFQEWDIKAGKLEMVSPENRVLADYSANALSICPRSYGMDFRDKPVDIVLMDRGSDPAAYEGFRADGALLFIRGAVGEYVDWAIEKTGAIGFITDFMRDVKPVRERGDLYDTLNYISFWWKHNGLEPKIGGFTLTPREGDKLAALCRKMAEEHAADSSKPAYPQATGFIDAKLYDGAIEVVETILPGETDENILITAHLCHPKPSANDNASGVAAGMEAVYTLKTLIDEGKLPPLKRGIRMIFIPEFSGTYPYLDMLGAEGRKKFKAGINLDMCGARQGSGYGPLTLSGLPYALPSVAEDAALYVFDEIRKGARALSGDTDVPMINFVNISFEAGSDHYILSDPTIGIPTPMWGQWPDKGYHTGSDSLDKIDPKVLAKSASFAAAYVYLLCNLDPEQARQLILRGRQKFVNTTLQSGLDNIEGEQDMARLEKRASLRLENRKACNQAYMSYFNGRAPELQPVIDAENAWIDNFNKEESALYKSTFYPEFKASPVEIPEMYRYIPERKYISPLNKIDDLLGADQEKINAYQNFCKNSRKGVSSSHRFESLIQYNINGKHSLWELAQRTIIEANEGSVEYVHAYVQFLAQIGLVKIHS